MESLVMNHPSVHDNKLVVFATTDTYPPLSVRAQRGGLLDPLVYSDM